MFLGYITLLYDLLKWKHEWAYRRLARQSLSRAQTEQALTRGMWKLSRSRNVRTQKSQSVCLLTSTKGA